MRPLVVREMREIVFPCAASATMRPATATAAPSSPVGVVVQRQRLRGEMRAVEA